MKLSFRTERLARLLLAEATQGPSEVMQLLHSVGLAFQGHDPKSGALFVKNEHPEVTMNPGMTQSLVDKIGYQIVHNYSDGGAWIVPKQRNMCPC